MTLDAAAPAAPAPQAVPGPAGPHVVRVHARRRRAARLLRLAQRKPLAAVGAVVLVLLCLGAALAPWLAPYDPLATNLRSMREAPSAAHWFGTDEVGRDLLTRVLYGGQLSLLVGFSSVLLGTTAGGVTGIVSGYFAGRVDMVIQRVMDALMAFPALILAMALMAVVGGSTPMTIAVIALILVPSTNRVVRSATLSVKERTFVEAARAIGAGSTRILAQHVLPNVTAPIIVIASVQLGGAILVQASLSFLGLGPSPPTPTWGGMLSGPGRAYMEESPWLAIFPGLAIAVAVLGFNLLGDGVRDVLDPRLRER